MFFAIFESQIKTVNTVIFALAVLSIPVLGLVIIFGLAGSTSEYGSVASCVFYCFSIF